ncbi:hypothetical protein VKT23_015947 [Stygiomarasmius scandens]|uniref:Uncharacterized protein n=1 Tax=Marasmiellus scandens TaxID=2682957 RepID=A0ABR1J0G9_9AGAR
MANNRRPLTQIDIQNNRRAQDRGQVPSRHAEHGDNARTGQNRSPSPQTRSSRSRNIQNSRKRTYEDFSESLAIRDPKKRQKHDRETLEPINRIGRWTARGIALNPDIPMIVKVGIAVEKMRGGKAFGATREELTDFSESEQNTMCSMFNSMVEYDSGLHELLAQIFEHEDQDTFENLLDELSDRANDARRDDTNTLKHLISTIIPANPNSQALDPPIPISRSKSDRSIQHPVIAALFCPRQYLFRMINELKQENQLSMLMIDGDDSADDLSSDEEDNEGQDQDQDDDEDEDTLSSDDDEDEDGNEEQAEQDQDQDAKKKHNKIPKSTTVVKHIQNAGVHLAVNGLDTWLYDLRKVEEGKSFKAKTAGLLRSYIGVRSFRAIFLGPSSVHENNPNETRASLAKIHNLARVTPHTIAYAIVQAHFMMSQVESWCLTDQEYDLQELYNYVVAFLSNPNSVLAKKTLRWWNIKVFSKKASQNKKKGKVNVVKPKSLFDKLIQVDANKSNRRAEKAAANRELEEAERRVAEQRGKQLALQELAARREERERRKRQQQSRSDDQMQDAEDEQEDEDGRVDDEDSQTRDELEQRANGQSRNRARRPHRGSSGSPSPSRAPDDDDNQLRRGSSPSRAPDDDNIQRLRGSGGGRNPSRAPDGARRHRGSSPSHAPDDDDNQRRGSDGHSPSRALDGDNTRRRRGSSPSHAPDGDDTQRRRGSGSGRNPNHAPDSDDTRRRRGSSRALDNDNEDNQRYRGSSRALDNSEDIQTSRKTRYSNSRFTSHDDGYDSPHTASEPFYITGNKI